MTYSYLYSEENRFSHPCTYMYTPIEGLTFFKGYFVSRNHYISLFSKYAAPALPSFLCEKKDMNSLLQQTEDIETKRLLSVLIYSDSVKKYSPAFIFSLDQLLRKFEVTRKIHAQYKNWKKKGQGNDLDYALYSGLAFILGGFYDHAHEPKYLNTLLKLNDALCSAAQEIIRYPETATITLHALLREKNHIQSLMVQQGLANEIA